MSSQVTVSSAFKPSAFRRWVSKDGSSEFPAESGRYHLYVSRNCPFAHRALVLRKIKGLESCISLDIVAYKNDENGWKFDPEVPGTTADRVNGSKYLKEVYFLADENYEGRYTVPVLWDKKTKTIVNNESSEIIRMFNTEFNDFCPTEEQRNLDFYPEELRGQIDGINEWVSRDINTGVYRAGFATNQEVYDKAVREVFAGLDKVEGILSRQRYLTGSSLTEADVRLYTSLVRFDRVYVDMFKCNKKRVIDYPNMWAYLRDLYQTTGFGDTTDFYLIDFGYQKSLLNLNPHGIMAIGPDLDFEAAHDRATKFT